MDTDVVSVEARHFALTVTKKDGFWREYWIRYFQEKNSSNCSRCVSWIFQSTTSANTTVEGWIFAQCGLLNPHQTEQVDDFIFMRESKRI